MRRINHPIYLPFFGRSRSFSPSFSMFSGVSEWVELLKFDLEPLWNVDLNHYTRNPLTNHLIPDDQNLAAGDDFSVFEKTFSDPYFDARFTLPAIVLGSNLTVRVYKTADYFFGVGQTSFNFPHLWIRHRLDGGEWSDFEELEMSAFQAYEMQIQVRSNVIFRGCQICIDVKS